MLWRGGLYDDWLLNLGLNWMLLNVELLLSWVMSDWNVLNSIWIDVLDWLLLDVL